MFSSLMMLVAVIAPVPAIVKSIKERITPFRAVIQGLITGAVCALMVMVIGDLAGSNVFDELYNSVNIMAEAMANDPNMAAVLGEDLTAAERLNMINQVYSQSIQMLPYVVFVMATVASYLEYIIISKIYKPGGVKAIPMTKMREFDLPRNFAFVWLAIYVLSLLITSTGIIGNNMVFLNINYIFDFAFILQGFSLVFAFCYYKKLPQVLGVVLIVAVLLTNLGQTVMMMAGFTDLIFGIKYRLKRVA